MGDKGISPSGMNNMVRASLVPDLNIHPMGKIFLSHMDTLVDSTYLKQTNLYIPKCVPVFATHFEEILGSMKNKFRMR